jgi:hypothetical protein
MTGGVTGGAFLTNERLAFADGHDCKFGLPVARMIHHHLIRVRFIGGQDDATGHIGHSILLVEENASLRRRCLR